MDAGEAVALLMTPAGRVDPYPTYAVLRAHGPLVSLDGRFFVATGHAVIGELLRDPGLLVTDEVYTRRVAPDWTPGPAERSIAASMLQRNPPDHTRLRRLAAGAFTPRRVAAMREAIAAQATTLADFMAHLLADGESEVDFMAEFAFPLPVRIICTLLGIPTGDQAWFRDQTAALTVVLEPQFAPTAELDAANRAATELAGYFAGLVAQRRRDPRDDLTTALVSPDPDGTVLSDDELLANLILLLVAGFETTTNLLGNGLVTLLEHPGAADALRADPGLAEPYVEELLRYDSPVQLTFRWSPRAGEFAGVPVPADAEVLLLLGAGNRDPDRFAAPDAFDPSREANQPLSFGAGAHYCLGAALARLEARIAFPLLLNAFPTLALAGPAHRRDRLTLRGYASLPVARR